MAEDQEIREIIKEINQNAIFIEKFDEALFGMGRVIGGEMVAAYDTDKCLDILIEREGFDEVEAWDHLNGILKENIPHPHKPIFVTDWRQTVEVGHTLELIKKNKDNLLSNIEIKDLSNNNKQTTEGKTEEKGEKTGGG